MQLVYFASVREAIGCDGEERDIPDAVKTISDCLHWLAGQGDQYARTFADRSKLRFARDQQMAKADALIGDAKELAIFPPVTGG